MDVACESGMILHDSITSLFFHKASTAETRIYKNENCLPLFYLSIYI
jgi:hypothetical protein